jgi:RsiW-degrading membrane proteinase PrsW (M82 family)
MTLTLYTAHLVVRWIGLGEDVPVVQYLVLVTGAITFAVLWRGRHGQGPLERVVAVAAGRARGVVISPTPS